MPTAGRVVLKPRRAGRPFFARHPWVYGDSIATVEGSPEPGEEVDVLSHEGAFIARGLYNPASLLPVRLYRWQPMPLDSGFWLDKLESALRLRTATLGLGASETAYRLVFSEGDGLSGAYGRPLRRVAGRSFLRAWPFSTAGSCCLTTCSHSRGSRRHCPARAGGRRGGGALSRCDVHVSGRSHLSPWRSWRMISSTWSISNPGRRRGSIATSARTAVAWPRIAGAGECSTFSATPAGSVLNALKHGQADSTLGIGSSAPALRTGRAQRPSCNGLHGAKFERGDVLKILERLKSPGRPLRCGDLRSAQVRARMRRDLNVALKGYRRLNLAAVGVLAPGGILATCSCSGLVDRPAFAMMLAEVAEESGRPIQILEQRGQPPDHPISAACSRERLSQVLRLARSGSESRSEGGHLPCFFSLATSSSNSAIRFSSSLSRSRSLRAECSTIGVQA